MLNIVLWTIKTVGDFGNITKWLFIKITIIIVYWKHPTLRVHYNNVFILTIVIPWYGLFEWSVRLANCIACDFSLSTLKSKTK